MLGKKIRNLRKENKISQEELAEKLGVSRQSISLWENGQTMPSMENIIAIANIFDVSTDVLLKDKSVGDVEKSKMKENKKKPLKKLFVILSAILILMIVSTSTIILVYKVSNRDLTAKEVLSSEEIFDLIAPITVEINAEGDDFTSTGTGCFIDNDGTIVTNYHVIEGCHTVKIKTQNGTIYKVETILGFDKERDLALLKTNCKNDNLVEIKTEKIKTGEKVYTLGSSLGLTGTFSEGIVSSASRKIEGLEFIQITAPISSGNSGGPLVDENGKIIGITTGAFTEGQNLNLAIPASAISQISREKAYSINEFFQLSQSKVVEQEKEEITEVLTQDENYTPVDIGYFDSLEELNEATQRNPGTFNKPVIVSISGSIVRTKENCIFLLEKDAQDKYGFYRIKDNLTSKTLNSKYTILYEIFMLDDTKNRVLTGDKVILKGIYDNSEKSITECIVISNNT